VKRGDESTADEANPKALGHKRAAMKHELGVKENLKMFSARPRIACDVAQRH
jgi:ABC-type transport system involved in cytochrome c biogenesis ATPase subunit